MPKYHINPETGEPGTCRAVIKCKFDQAQDEHYSSKEEAREAYEVIQKAKEPKPKAYYTEKALNAPLTNVPQPEWTQKLKDELKATTGDDTVEVIDIIETPAGQMAVTWESGSTRAQDISIQQDRGFSLPGINLRDLKTGEINSYVRFSHTSDSSVETAYGNDKWTAFRYMSEMSGTDMNVTDWERVEDGYPKRVEVFHDDMTDEERIEAKRKVWYSAFSTRQTETRSNYYDTLPRSEKSYMMEPRNAPTDEKILDQELAQVNKEFTKNLRDFKSDHGEPTVDFSNVANELRGTGIGSSLYIYGARMLAKDNLRLRGSGVQSGEAQQVWGRFAANEKLPIVREKKKWKRYKNSDEYYYMDFRDTK